MSNGGQRNTILEYLKDTVLAKVTTGNGYNFTLATKERGLKHPEQMSREQFPAVFIASADEDIENITNKHYKSLMTVYFHCFAYADSIQNAQE